MGQLMFYPAILVKDVVFVNSLIFLQTLPRVQLVVIILVFSLSLMHGIFQKPSFQPRIRNYLLVLDGFQLALVLSFLSLFFSPLTADSPPSTLLGLILVMFVVISVIVSLAMVLHTIVLNSLTQHRCGVKPASSYEENKTKAKKMEGKKLKSAVSHKTELSTAMGVVALTQLPKNNTISTQQNVAEVDVEDNCDHCCSDCISALF